MAIIQVTKQELIESHLEYLLVPSSFDYDFASEMYYWDTREKAATICMLAGIGKILDNKDIDSK